MTAGCLLLHTCLAFAQAPAKTYAVIIGISEYQNEGISALDFAHKDATYFANYLKSTSGGSVPDENIILLQNEKATYSAVYNALDWLLETCRENDLVYFYFSGHGDMENNTIYKLGFLLTYNTPRTNYINNALRIEDLNNYANTLSLNTKAKVILITDACHSGKLAGNDYRGSYLVGEQLQKVYTNEVRIASCAPDQVSVEDVKWGGGRGVFSYYLLNGLTGLADEKKDGKVSVKEITTYLRSSMGNDPVLKSRNQQQTPVVKGNEDLTLASIDPDALAKLKGAGPADAAAPIVTLAPLPPDAAAAFLKQLPERIEQLIDFIKLSSLNASELPFALITQVVKNKNARIFGVDIPGLMNHLKSNPDALKRFNRKLTELISNRGQDIVNLYLNGDEAEMERRRYYKSIQNEYESFAKMFEVALKLTDAKSPLAKILEIKYHYFSGVALRLKIPLTDNPSELITAAFAAQTEALQMEENAAYIHNELGFLCKLKNDLQHAEASFIKASEIAPGWSIPWSNRANLCIDQKEYDKGLAFVAIADSLQKDYQGTYINAGMLYEGKHNWLQAEENLRKSIALNARFYLPYDRLGFVYTSTTAYALADSFFYEAAVRKLGYNVDPIVDAIGDGGDEPFDEVVYKPCTINGTVAANDVMTRFVVALNYLNAGKTKAAEIEFLKVIGMDSRHPLAHHYLGKIMREQKRWAEADIYLNYAMTFYLDKNKFKSYCDSVQKFLTKKDNCIIQNFTKSHYNKAEDYFLLADCYEQWNHYSEAEALYENVIRMDSMYIGGYYKLWQLMEKMNRYNDAELVLHQYKSKLGAGIEQFNAFYKRVTEKFPESGDWFYRAGSFHYREAVLHPKKYKDDIFVNAPDKDINPENNELYLESDRNNSFDLSRKQQFIYGTGELIEFGESVQYPRWRCIEYLTIADSLLKDAEQRADINNKIGDMYVAMGNTARALPYFQKASRLQGNNAGIRLKLINTLEANFRFQDARQQLDTLSQRKEINYSKLLLKAKYDMHAGNFGEAAISLKQAKDLHPVKMPETDDLNGRLYLLSEKYAEAIPYYAACLKNFPNNAEAMYTMAKIYYLSDDQSQCYEWLKKSISAGFNYYWVLKYDPVFEKERNTNKWKELTAAAKPKPFPEKNKPDNENN